MLDTMALEAAYALHGFVWAYRFGVDGSSRLTMPYDVENLAAAPLDGVHCWVHLNLTDRRALEWVAAQDFLHDESKESLVDKEPQQSLDYADDTQIFGVLGDFTRDFEDITEEIGYLRFCIGHGFLITARRHPLKSAHSVQHALIRGAPMEEPIAVFAALVDAILDEVGAHIRQMAVEIDAIEDRVLDDKVRDDRRRLGPVRRQAVRLHRLLTGMHGSFRRLADPDDNETVPETVRDAADNLLQRGDSLHQDVYALQERARLLQEEMANKIQEETNRHLFVLSILTTLFLPPTLVSGLFGMNVHGLPFANETDGFVIVLLVAALSAVVVYFLIRNRGMLD